MADALVNSRQHSQQTIPTTTNNISSETSKPHTKDSDLNVSDKENTTPDRNYRYKVYLEPEEDISSQAKRESNRVPFQERPALAEMSRPALAEMPVASLHPLASQKRRVTATNPTARRKSEGTHRPSITTSLQQRKAGRRISHGIVTGT